MPELLLLLLLLLLPVSALFLLLLLRLVLLLSWRLHSGAVTHFVTEEDSCWPRSAGGLSAGHMMQ
jgi:hypothetical protein